MTTPSERKWRLYTTILAALFLAAFAGYIFAHDEGTSKGIKLVTSAVLINLTSSLIVFAVGSSLLRRDSESDIQTSAEKWIIDPLKASFTDKLAKLEAAIRDLQGATTLEQIDWAGLIAGASEIDFVVQGWDGWFEKNDTHLARFLESGGKFRLFVYDPISEKTSQARALMAERLGKSPHDVVSEITGTTTALKGIRDGLPGKRRADDIEIVLITQLNLYFAARFVGKQTSFGKNRDAIVFSIYSHTKSRVNSMPAVTIFTDMNPYIGKWFDAELTLLRRSST